jgi:Domain of Unknown Function (DUF1080)
MLRNLIWKIFASGILLIAGCAQPPLTFNEETGWTTLFDTNSNLNQWTLVGDANWRIQDGALQADFLRGKAPSYLVTKATYQNFDVRAEVWVDSETNTGIFIRCGQADKVGTDTCYEINIWDTRPDPTYGTGAIVDVAKVSPMPRAGGRWNTLEIYAQGDMLTVKLNGQVTAQGRDGKHLKGYLALQYGSGVVKFRKVQIRSAS